MATTKVGITATPEVPRWFFCGKRRAKKKAAEPKPRRLILISQVAF